MHGIVFYLYTFDVVAFNNHLYISLEILWLDLAPIGTM